MRDRPDDVVMLGYLTPATGVVLTPPHTRVAYATRLRARRMPADALAV